MSVFKNIKSLFIVEEDAVTEKKSTPKNTSKGKTPTVKNTTSVPKPKPPVTSSIPAKGTVDKKFMDVLFKALEANNIEGFDYLEYKQSIQSLSSMPMDEETRFKSAFAMAKTMGTTTDHLVTTAKHYLSILEKEENKFENALQQQIDAKIGKEQQEIVAMEKSVAEKAEQIKKLTEQITEIQQRIEKSKSDISEATSKINTTKSNFIASYNMLKGQIEKDVENIQKYLMVKPTNATENNKETEKK